jgi:hypothetical protein
MNLSEKLKNILPDLPALAVVLISGAFGALLSCWWNLSIGEKEFASGVAGLPWLLRVFLGSFGAAAAVFVLAKTDTSKLIHCGIIAALSGMAGPYLVIKALSTVVSVNPNLVQIGSAIGIVASSTTTLNNAIQAPTATNPQKIVDVFDQTAQATASYLTALKNAPENERQRALADNKGQLAETLKVLGIAASIVPKQSVPLIKKVANAAKEAGVPAVAEEAQKILDTNSAVHTAAETADNIGKVYFITPGELTDNILHELRDRIRARFPLADLQPAVHPTRRMEPGLEVVYYRDIASDKQIANDLTTVVSDYLKEHNIVAKNISGGKNASDQTPPPFQFDIHIGPDIAIKLVGISKPIPSTN